MNFAIDSYPETNFTFEYSAESFSTTEIDYAIEVINDLIDVWKTKIKNKIIINLPSTIECSTPNVFADQIAYVSENINCRDNVILSVHAHNDRGTAVATSELSLLAGAQRIEGTLFGNGERTGNVDLINVAMNMFVQGIDPKLNFTDINDIKNTYEICTNMHVGQRHPYAGEFAFTAFAGSHQDAISKVLKKIKSDSDNTYWNVPYLPLNPEHINRQLEPIIRINSQSGKGGVSYILENYYGYIIPKEMKKDVGYFIKDLSDKLDKELFAKDIIKAFSEEYINVSTPISIKNYSIVKDKKVKLTVTLEKDGVIKTESTSENGPIDAFIKILRQMGYVFKFECFMQDSDNVKKEKSEAITYINLKNDSKNVWAIGKDNDTVKSSFLGIISAINKL